MQPAQIDFLCRFFVATPLNFTRFGKNIISKGDARIAPH